jgi:hypothetical protein
MFDQSEHYNGKKVDEAIKKIEKMSADLGGT